MPKLPVLRIVSAGNVAGEGAKMALLSMRERAAALTLLEEVRYVELSDHADFNDRFIGQLEFPAIEPTCRDRVRSAGRAHRDIADRRGWELAVHSLPASLHNSPRAIAPAVSCSRGN